MASSTSFRFAPVVALASVAAGMWWALWRPLGTFSLSSVHAWADQLLVVAMWVAVALAFFAARGRHQRALAALSALAPGGFIGAAVVGSWFFRTTTPSLFGSLFLVAALWLLTSARLIFSSRAALVGLAIGALGGGLHLAARRPPPAATTPSTLALAAPDEVQSWLVLPCGRASLHLNPLLAMQATSADGFWPGLSAKDSLEGEPPLQGAERRASLSHTSQTVDAMTVLPHEVTSHLNRFTDLRFTGAQHPRIQFEGTAPLDFLPFDYPKGRVAYFAYVTARELVVAHGSNAEKGPFVRVASTPLSDEVLRVTLFDGAVPLCTLAFLDFINQADRSNESPTAGEGVPPNVIQFGLPGKGEPIPMLHLSLAETGIGAGRDTIRHAAGTYQNRIRISEVLQ